MQISNDGSGFNQTKTQNMARIIRNFYVTSPIYYVNDAPHIGHAYTSIACDVAARYNKLDGCDVFFTTGTDEHGQKVEKSALACGKDTQEFCDENSQKFRDLSPMLNLSNNEFIRTTEERHKKCAQRFWEILEEKGHIYKGVYEGWYSVRDEAFYSADEVVDGKAPSGAEVTWHKEESYFFRLTTFQENLILMYESFSNDFILPKERLNEVISFVKGGLKDLSISRNSFSWGIKVPGDEKSVIYVWIDALTSYLSALGFPDESAPMYKKFWSDIAAGSPTHIIGKDILRFHAVYWPALLMAAEINVPYTIYAHGWWTNNGQKISKSVGNMIDPQKELEWIESLGCTRETAADYLRYFLMREIPFGNDGDYSRTSLVTRINAELANNIGNLVQRTLTMIMKHCNGEIPAVGDNPQFFPKISFKPYSDAIFLAMRTVSIDRMIAQIVEFSTLVNKNFNDAAPWNLQKENKIPEMNLALFMAVESIRIIGIFLTPFVPTSAKKILDLLNVKEAHRTFSSLRNPMDGGHKINEPTIIFPRLELEPLVNEKKL